MAFSIFSFPLLAVLGLVLLASPTDAVRLTDIEGLQHRSRETRHRSTLQVVRTCGGNSDGAPCSFPFTYRGQNYTACTSAEHDQPWCYTDATRVLPGNKWGNCDCSAAPQQPLTSGPPAEEEEEEETPVDEGTAAPIDQGAVTPVEEVVRTCGGNANGAACKFPFSYRGQDYTACTSVEHDQPWCHTDSTRVIPGFTWGNCNCPAGGQPLPSEAPTEHKEIKDKFTEPAEEYDCCCRARPCKWSEEQDKAARNVVLGQSMFNDDHTGNVVACCNNISTSGFWRCAGGRILDDSFCAPQMSKKTSSISSCKQKLSWWFQREDWWTLLSDYTTLPWTTAHEEGYKAYIPCLVEKQSHVRDVVLHDVSFFHSSGGNPVRSWVTSREECSGLSGQQLREAAEESYEEMCPFDMKDDDYKPNFQPTRACAYNETSKTIFFSNATMCPEGHRCACPVYRKEELGDAHEQNFKSGMSVYGYLAMLSGGANYINLVHNHIFAVGAVATVVAPWLQAWGFSIYLGGIASGVLVYGGGLAVNYLTYTCQANVGCWPMDCAHEAGVGCRINLADDSSDPRNPYWFMPPPMHKCTANRWGTCQLDTCSVEDARLQRVGEFSVEYGFFRKKQRSTLLNCQPLLAEDMTHSQVRKLENKVAGIRSREHEMQRRVSLLVKQLHKFCPFLKSSESIDTALCNDGAMCDIETVPGPNCCSRHRGIMRCPAKFPKLCADDFCDSDEGACAGEGRGGIMVCAAESTCPWVLYTPEDDMVECMDGNLVNMTEFNDTALCSGQQGLKRCPWNLPVMCANRSCFGEHCCAEDTRGCADFGGPRSCDEIPDYQPPLLGGPEIQPIGHRRQQSAGRRPLHSLLVSLSCAALLLANLLR